MDNKGATRSVTTTIAGSDRQGFANGQGSSAQFNGLGLIAVEYVGIMHCTVLYCNI